MFGLRPDDLLLPSGRWLHAPLRSVDLGIWTRVWVPARLHHRVVCCFEFDVRVFSSTASGSLIVSVHPTFLTLGPRVRGPTGLLTGTQTIAPVPRSDVVICSKGMSSPLDKHWSFKPLFSQFVTTYAEFP